MAREIDSEYAILTWSIASVREIEFAAAKLTDSIVAQGENLLAHFVHLILEHRWEQWPKSFGGKEADDV